MLCKEVKRVIYFFLDGSLGNHKQQEFAEHIGLCPDCDKRISIQRRLRSFIRKRLAPVTAPSHLKTRIGRSIRAFRTEWSR